MQPGELQTFGYISEGKRGNALCRLSAMSSKSPRVHLALQYVIRNYFRISDVITVRLGKSIANVGNASENGSTLIHYTSDTTPDFHYSESYVLPHWRRNWSAKGKNHSMPTANWMRESLSTQLKLPKDCCRQNDPTRTSRPRIPMTQQNHPATTTDYRQYTRTQRRMKSMLLWRVSTRNS